MSIISQAFKLIALLPKLGIKVPVRVLGVVQKVALFASSASLGLPAKLTALGIILPGKVAKILFAVGESALSVGTYPIKEGAKGIGHAFSGR